MKILIVNTSDINGGAARAAYRLHKSLLEQEIDSTMVVQTKTSDDFTVVTTTNKFLKTLNRLRPIIDSLPVQRYKEKSKTLFSPSWFGFNNIIDQINNENPDIVHLHWITGGMIKIEDLSKIKAPIVWSLHDNWAFTGGCHIMWDCNRYISDCGTCPQLKSDKSNDLSRKTFNRKLKSFSAITNMTIVGLSKWLNNCSKNSTLLGKRKHLNLPNPINTNIYKPFDKDKARELWNLPQRKKLVLFGAMNATSDVNKGFKELSKALNELEYKNLELVVFGSGKPEKSPDFGFTIHYLGKLTDDVSLVTLYSAVDIMVVPSLQEAFGQTASEAMSCATPVVCFNTTGLKDIVDHLKNGYLAEPFNTTDLKDGIEWILNNNENEYEKLCQGARQKVINEFDSVKVAKKYIELYKKILEDA